MIYNKANLQLHAFADKTAWPSGSSALVHVTEKFTEFTDGYLLVRITTPHVDPQDLPLIKGHAPLKKIPEPNGFVVAASALQEIEGGIKKSTLPVLENAWLTENTDSERVEFLTTDLDVHRPISIHKSDTSYPDTERVWPEGKAAFTIEWSTTLMMKIMAYFKKIGLTGIRLELFDDKSAMRFTGELPETGQKISALLMPRKS